MAISLSIIIPCYNEEQLLPVCLNSILAQKKDMGAHSEIIIAVNGSTDSTLEIAHSYQKQDSMIRVLCIDEANKKLAMNRALDIVKNRLVVFCDADSYLDTNALKKIKNKLCKNQYAIVGAIRRPHIDKKLINNNFPATYFMLHYAKRLSLKTKQRLSVQGWLMGVNLNILDGLRFPLDNSPDDIWLSAYTWMNYGADAIGYIPYAIGTYIPPSTLADMKRQISRHRSNHKSVQKFHPELDPYFIARKRYYSSTESNQRWRLLSIMLGVNFDSWIIPYQDFLKNIDNSIALGEYKYGETSGWDRISTSKNSIVHTLKSGRSKARDTILLPPSNQLNHHHKSRV